MAKVLFGGVVMYVIGRSRRGEILSSNRRGEARQGFYSPKRYQAAEGERMPPVPRQCTSYLSQTIGGNRVEE